MEKIKLNVYVKMQVIETEIELKRDVQKLAKDLNVNETVARKLAVMEVIGDEGTYSFKNWNNRRIYFTTSYGSNNQNSKQRYYDLETNELNDNGLSYLYQDQMKFVLNQIQ